MKMNNSSRVDAIAKLQQEMADLRRRVHAEMIYRGIDLPDEKKELSIDELCSSRTEHKKR